LYIHFRASAEFINGHSTFQNVH